MADIVKQMIARPIKLTDKIIKEADFVCSFKQDCAEIKKVTETLRALLREAARASNHLYEQPARWIIINTEEILDMTLKRVFKCQANRLQRLFTTISPEAIQGSPLQIEYAIGNVSWLLRISTSADEYNDEYIGFPPMVIWDPILCLIWKQIVAVSYGTLDDQDNAAEALARLARENNGKYIRLIIEEGGVPPLVKLAEEGRMEGKESAMQALSLLGRHLQHVE